MYQIFLNLFFSVFTENKLLDNLISNFKLLSFKDKLTKQNITIILYTF